MADVPTREPLAVRATVVAFANALVHLAVTFGVSLTADQTSALSVVINLASILAVVVWSRGKVTPVDDPDLVASEVYEAKHAA